MYLSSAVMDFNTLWLWGLSGSEWQKMPASFNRLACSIFMLEPPASLQASANWCGIFLCSLYLYRKTPTSCKRLATLWYVIFMLEPPAPTANWCVLAPWSYYVANSGFWDLSRERLWLSNVTVFRTHLNCFRWWLFSDHPVESEQQNYKYMLDVSSSTKGEAEY